MRLACLIDYVFVEWESEGEHSVLQGKLVELCDKSSGYVAGTKIKAYFSGKRYVAMIITAGMCWSIIYVMYLKFFLIALRVPCTVYQSTGS